MGKRNKKEVIGHPASWVVSDTYQINGRSIVKGTELSIKGESGRFIFIKHVKTPSAEWIDVKGGRKGYEMWRSFSIDRVKTVHRIAKTRKNLVT
jgi:hypothetical protein